MEECRESKIDFSRYEPKKDGSIISKWMKKPMSDKNTTKYGYILNTFRDVEGNQCTYSRHRVIWYYFNGNIPDDMEIDHIIPIRNGGTNALSNLRCVPRKDNLNNPLTREYMKNNVWNDKNRNEKISQGNKGKKASDEQKKKQSIAMSGENHPNWGKKRPEHASIMRKKDRDAYGRWINKGDSK